MKKNKRIIGGNRQRKKRLVNKRAKMEYQILEKFEAGIELIGAEVKSLREGRGNLIDSFVKIREGEARVYNFNIPRYKFASLGEYDPVRSRRLLLHKKEIDSLSQKEQRKRMVLVPLSVFIKGNVFKMELGLGRGKKSYERREELKKRDIDRESKRIMKDWNRR